MAQLMHTGSRKTVTQTATAIVFAAEKKTFGLTFKV